MTTIVVDARLRTRRIKSFQEQFQRAVRQDCLGVTAATVLHALEIRNDIDAERQKRGGASAALVGGESGNLKVSPNL